MFSGIVKGVGRVAETAELGADRRWVIDAGDVPLGPLAIGGSVAVNGCCLTATTLAGSRFTVDLSTQTLAVTTLGRLGAGARVNLEAPLKLGEPLDGHLVQGHVDGVGEVVKLEAAGRSTVLGIELPEPLARYVAQKGSIAIDGVSLTVNAVRGNLFEVNVIPHTQTVTVIGGYRLGDAVNIEVDMIARYLERLGRRDDERGLGMELLKKHGYARKD
ncbi:MAG TPA: riboflavin synthase [Gammaproteobacteria bacterium]|nr:riboflavin synthase [Gammaproteobacteria bacterium]